MIADIDDYRYVDGDLSAIIIDGDIMPLRSNQKILRGEDVTFLQESLHRRFRVFGNPKDAKETFTRKIQSDQLLKLLDQMQYDFQVLGDSRYSVNSAFLKSKPLSGYYDTYPELDYYLYDDIKTSGQAFQSGTPLYQSDMRALFQALEDSPYRVGADFGNNIAGSNLNWTPNYTAREKGWIAQRQGLYPHIIMESSWLSSSTESSPSGKARFRPQATLAWFYEFNHGEKQTADDKAELYEIAKCTCIWSDSSIDNQIHTKEGYYLYHYWDFEKDETIRTYAGANIYDAITDQAIIAMGVDRYLDYTPPEKGKIRYASFTLVPQTQLIIARHDSETYW